MTPQRWQITCCMLLCLACGIVDAVGFLQHGIFAANMTGNTVLLGISLAQMQWVHALERALPLLAFFVGAMLARLLLNRTGKRAWVPLLLEAALIAGALVLLPDSKLSLAVIAFAMGVQSTAVTQFAGVTLSTVVITSTMARIAEAMCDRLTLPRRQPVAAAVAVAGPPLPLYLLTWLCYLAGALVAGLGNVHPLAGMLVAAVLVLVAAWTTTRTATAAATLSSRAA